MPPLQPDFDDDSQPAHPLETMLKQVTMERDHLAAGTAIGSFVLRQVIEHDDFGVLYLATASASGMEVTIEEYLPTALASRGEDGVLRPRSDAQAELLAAGLQAFLQESDQLGRLSHPALMRIGPVWQTRGTAFRLRLDPPGRTLASVRREQQAPPSDAWLRGFAEPLLGALERVHGVGLVHGNLRPGRIMVQPDGTPLLMDFGAAREAITAVAPWLGARPEPEYEAPERLDPRSRIDAGPPADLYALAAVLQFCITGEAPVAAARRQKGGQPAPRLAELLPALRRRHPEAQYSESLVAAIDRALALDARERPQSVDEFRADVLRSPPLASAAVGATPPAAPEPAPSSEEPGAARLDSDQTRVPGSAEPSQPSQPQPSQHQPPQTPQPQTPQPQQQPPHQPQRPPIEADEPATAAGANGMPSAAVAVTAAPEAPPPMRAPVFEPRAAVSPWSSSRAVDDKPVAPESSAELAPIWSTPPATSRDDPLPPVRQSAFSWRDDALAPPRSPQFGRRDEPRFDPQPDVFRAERGPRSHELPLDGGRGGQGHEPRLDAAAAPPLAWSRQTERPARRWPWAVGGGLLGVVLTVTLVLGVQRVADDARIAWAAMTMSPVLQQAGEPRLPGDAQPGDAQPSGAAAQSAGAQPGGAQPSGAIQPGGAQSAGAQPGTSPPGALPSAAVAERTAPSAGPTELPPLAPAGDTANGRSQAAAAPASAARPAAPATTAPAPPTPPSRVAATEPPATAVAPVTVGKAAQTAAKPAPRPRPRPVEPRPPVEREAVAEQARPAVVSPAAACAPRSNFSLYQCMKAKCQDDAYYVHPQCIRLRRTDEVS